jgi:FAD/FMN-containing dehydrogenase/Fe-S oxidoreductase
MNVNLNVLSARLKGEVYTDEVMRTLYATDASVYREKPLAVVYPANEEDIRELIRFAREHGLSLIPRTAGTSLAGQVVGNGIIVDVSRTFTEILEVNAEKQWVRVQPGVVRDELNMFLAGHGLFFGPETSTSNRAMIGGMVGNNSSGSNSLIYGSTRDNILEVKGFLSDGSEVVFKELNEPDFQNKCFSEDKSLETRIYQKINQILDIDKNRENILKEFPKPSIKRRNTGYALDVIARSAPFKSGGPKLNPAKLIAGSEGTLMFITEVKLKCRPLPPKHKGLVCVHFHSMDEALQANLTTMKHNPTACELMDDFILSCTKNNPEQSRNRFFLKDNPKALLVVEFTCHSIEEVEAEAESLIYDLKKNKMGFYYPLITGEDIKKVWSLRKAALGLLFTIPGDAKPVAVIEDTSVAIEDLPAYVTDFRKILKDFKLSCVFYGHAGAGELHLRPVINLKTAEGQKLFRSIADATARLVKKYNGSLSGEHGDGRLRGEFIRYMVGEENYTLFRTLKETWDPKHIFNPGKIVETPLMDTDLRYKPDVETPDIETVFDFSQKQGYLRAAEFCNGSGDCRKTHHSGGTMCPSYMATRDEKHTTRARANILREYIRKPFLKNRFNHPEIYEVMDLCLSCKACKSECPSSVDVARLKAEFLQHYYEANGVSLRTRMIAGFTAINRLASFFPGVYNFFISNKVTSRAIKRTVGFATERSLPKLQKTTFQRWIRGHKSKADSSPVPQKKVYLYNDEFTNYNDTETGQKAVFLLEKLGYRVEVPPFRESGRTWLSKGMLKEAREIAIKNVMQMKDIVTEDTPLVGIEPSAILAFRDEYPELVGKDMSIAARQLTANALLFDEFIAREIKKGHITPDAFTDASQKIMLHGHCHQKSLASMAPTVEMLSLPRNYEVEVIPSGCCGMAGSFGYEKEHYEVSMKIGELVLFPAIRQKENGTIVAAPGTSCRRQIKDGTGEIALHPVEILYEAMKSHKGDP